MGRFVVYFVGILLFVSCATIPKRVIRDTNTYTAEILAGLQREQEAATALFAAADRALAAGEEESCREYAGPALLIQTKAQPQAHRALYLAGLPYPLADGSLPDPKDAQPDPGPAPALGDQAAAGYCVSPADPEADPAGLEVGGEDE